MIEKRRFNLLGPKAVRLTVKGDMELPVPSDILSVWVDVIDSGFLPSPYGEQATRS